MKFSLAAAALPLLSLVAAAPYGSDHKDTKDYGKDKEADKGWKDDGKGWKDDKAKHFKTWPFEFTSTAVAWAGPEKIVNNSQVAVPGLDGAYGTFAFGLNSVSDVICYNITVYVRGNYSSPAATATHIHQAPVGRAGPPRLAFPNPTPLGNTTSLDEFSWRASYGCLRGPFRTGLNGTAVTGATGVDTAVGFTIGQLEANITNFFADTHTVEFPAGAIRGQLEWKKAY